MTAPPAAVPGLFAPAVPRRALLIFLPAALITGGVVWALYWLDRGNEYALHEQAGAHLVELHASIITRELESVKSDLLYLANKRDLRDFVGGPGAEKRPL